MINSKQTCDELKNFYGGEDARPDPYAAGRGADSVM